MAFDPLDMNNYKVEKLPKMQKSNFEIWMARLGGPLAIIASSAPTTPCSPSSSRVSSSG